MNKYFQGPVNRKDIYIHSTLVLCLAIFSFLWYKHFARYAFSMDDIGVIKYYADTTKSFLEQTFLNIGANRYRPVFSLFQYFEYRFLGKNYAYIVYFNIGFNILIITLFYSIILKITRRNYLIPFLITLIYITSRFSYYNITEFNGILEAASIFWLLFIVLFSIKYWSEKNTKYFWPILFFYLLIVFTHERYIVLVGFIVFMLLLSNFVARKQKIIYSLYAFSITVLNIFVKIVLLKIPFFVGTGSSYDMGFKLSSSIYHYLRSLLNIFGFNNGPAYLNGYAVHDMSIREQLIVSTILISSLVIIVKYIYSHIITNRDKENKTNEVMILLLFLSAFLLLILSFSLTIRVEERWLYAPFVLYILYLSYMVGKDGYKLIPVLILLVLSSAYMDNFYKKYLDAIFFIGDKKYTNMVINETVRKYGKSLKNKDIYLIDTNVNSNWAQHLKDIISVNSDISNLKVKTIPTLYAVHTSSANTLIYLVGNKFEELKQLSPNLKNAKLISGEYVLGGGDWISKELSVRMNSGNGTLKGSIFVDSKLRLPNKITIFINNKKVYTKTIVTLGETNFSFIYKPHKNILVKIVMDKAITPYKLGIGADQRELSVILKEFSFN